MAPPSQWDDSPTGRLLQEAREQAMTGIDNGYRVDFSATRCILVTKKEALTLPDGTEYSLLAHPVIHSLRSSVDFLPLYIF